MNRLKRLIVEIHHRSLWQVLLIYIGAALMAYQAVQALTEGLGLPQWFPAFAIVLFIVGLPIVLATAFVREVAPPTVATAEPTPLTEAEAARIEVETAAAQLEARRRHRFLTWRNAAASFVVVLAAWGVVAAGWLLLHEDAAEASAERKSVAVLPFVNLSGDPENEYFSDGITGDIINQLSKIADLRVISRTSVMQYKGTARNLREIGQELNVATVLEGEVQRVGDRVRINAQLIDAETDEHMWAEQYNRELADIFEIQSDVAQQIASALHATLTPLEIDQIERKPTQNQQAYEYYLRGNEYYVRQLVREDAETAVQMYRRAIDLDPNFALAYAALARALTWLSFEFGEPDALRRAKEAMDRALELDPDLPEAHLALGDYYYEGYRDYEEALEHYKRVEAEVPGHADAIAMIGWALRRQGRWEEATANVERALELDPRNHAWIYSQGQTYVRMRRFVEAERYLDRGIALAPHHPNGYQEKAILYLSWRADKHRALQALQVGARRADLAVLLLGPFWKLGILCRIFPEELSELLEQLPIHTFTSAIDSGSYYLFKAETRAASGETTRAFALYDSARSVLEEWIQTHPDARLGQHPGEQHSLLGLAYAGSGRPPEAVREGERAVRALHPSEDAVFGPYGLVGLAWIHVRVGEHEAALDQLSYLLSVPSILSTRLVRLDPIWDPLRDHARFQALLERYEQ